MVNELMYGALLLTAIAAAPDIEIKLRLNYKAVQSVSYRFPDLKATMIKALLLTALAMVPTLMKLPRSLTQWRLFKYLPLAPWILICCFKFPQHVGMYMFTIGNTKYMDSTPLVLGLMIYFILFGMAIEMAIHWMVYARMCIAGFVLVTIKY
ncbi:uncharacterized protein [Drosophila kikkawai]|uniref:Uncharacterized protein n=1 Tax=Drosophila kikkawai TaxID=30033 RepID=A0A6P4JBE8_DROKI|nr:uncharacterized protein LOC108085921 [Drosophila kikkawai]